MKDITITVQGNVGTPPEERVDKKGRTMCTFRLASAPRWFHRESQSWKDGGTSWFSVSCFGRLADHAVQSLKKGDPVVVIGRLEIREYQTENSRGTSADLKAEALGHDLTQGISEFRRAQQGSEASDAEERQPAIQDQNSHPQVQQATADSEGAEADSSALAESEPSLTAQARWNDPVVPGGDSSASRPQPEQQAQPQAA